ncbi:DUF1566 domain-containing protein [Chromobacterium haemolyticum]|uniref:DUF1566 domain-containing protein n=1 Tax=Chromobacterium haemolyticum TaxID=394935 RepID=A0A1W0D5T6_9NEIS|nr:DUF1566 domain-containing protein [Chromobacterium haemolyticum]OQS42303.1 hypothetical protein B0T45_05790 [Chromobacterium haemolyticum]
MEITLPELKEGEKYAGLILVDGKPSHHVVLLDGDIKATWGDAMAWAAEQSGDLPNREEQALLYANLKSEFEPSWYWSNTQYSRGDAYGQDFDGGYQFGDAMSSYLRARAVRRLPI